MIPQAITSRGGAFNPRMILAAALCLMGVFLAAFSFGAPSLKGSARSTSASSIGSTLSPNAVGNWAIVPSANATEQYFSGVSCVSNSDCWAVGYYINTENLQRTLIEHWNGSVWTIVPSPNTTLSAIDSSYLLDVKCNSTSDCWAVGFSSENGSFPVKDHTLVEHWNGTSWSIVPSPDAGTRANRFYNVTCISSSDCWAAGYQYSGTGTRNQTLIEHWNGSSWSVVPSANTSPTVSNTLHDITCASATDCWAVGRYLTANGYQTLIEHWNGSAWSIVTSPNSAVDQSNYLYGVTCASASDCWTAGFYETGEFDSYDDPITQTLMEHWDGVAWSVVPSPSTSPTQINYLLDITCSSSSQCWAVGYAISYDENSEQPVIERWNGASWSIVASPITDTARFNHLDAVTCISSSECWIVGDSSSSRTLTQRWDGNIWSIVNSPSAAGGGSDDSLNDVTCTTTSNCWAVGTSRFGDPFIQHWDGSSWSIVAGANQYFSELKAVTCNSASDCWAVGVYYVYDVDLDESIAQTLTIHWNGSSWSIVPSPSTSVTENNYPFDVACTSASDCWMVGTYDNGGAGQTLIEHWNGSSWSIVSSPSVAGEPLNFLRGVTCTSASNCWAVGNSGNNDTSTNATLIEHWDGTSWSIVSSPSPQQQSILEAVTCVAASDCWAVGSAFDALIEHWNGTAWTLASAPPDGGALNDVSCSSATNCWAVGESSGGTRTAHWDGTSWSSVPSPSITSSDKLSGVACPSAIRCWAVGAYEAGDKFTPFRQTLIEQFTAGLEITSSSRSHGQFSLTGQTVANASVDIQASPNLIAPFVTIDTVTANAAGVFEYIDPNSSSFQKRFYRAVFP